MNLESVPCFAEIWSTYNPSQWRVQGGRAVWSTTPWTRKSAVQISLRSWIITFHFHFHELDNPSFLRRQESYDEKKMERKRQDSSSTSNGAIKTTCIGNILFSTLRELSVNWKDLQALTLVGPTRDNLVLDPLAVLHLKNWLYIIMNHCKL